MKTTFCSLTLLLSLTLTPPAQAQDLIEKAPGQFWSTSQLGLSRMCSSRATGSWVTMLLDRRDPNNQRILASSTPQIIPYGSCADFFIPWSGDDGCLQRDVFYGIPAGLLSQGVTYAEIRNYEIGGDDRIWNGNRCTPTVVPPPPPPPPPPPCISPGSFSFGGAPTIARFPTGFPNPWFPEIIGPFYFAVPSGLWHVTMWTGDDHVDDPTRAVLGKNDGPQDERGNILFDSGQVIGATNDVPDNKNLVFTDFGNVQLTGFSKFWIVNAAPANPPAPTSSFYPVVLTITCAGSR